MRVTRLLLHDFRGWDDLDLRPNGHLLIAGVPRAGRTDIIALLKALDDAGIRFKDLHTTQSSLEDIFVSLLRGNS